MRPISCIQKGGILDGNFAYYLAGFGVYLIVGLTAIYTIFLLALSRIALSVLLALGPLFIALLLFASTKRFFEAWLAQLANYAFITILTVLVAALMLRVVTVSAQQAVSTGGGIQIANAVRVCMAAGLTFLVMRQVMPMAAGLASGLALSSFGVVSAALAWGFGGAVRSTGQFARGLVDGQTNRWDPLESPGRLSACDEAVCPRRSDGIQAGQPDPKECLRAMNILKVSVLAFILAGCSSHPHPGGL